MTAHISLNLRASSKYLPVPLSTKQLIPVFNPAKWEVVEMQPPVARINSSPAVWVLVSGFDQVETVALHFRHRLNPQVRGVGWRNTVSASPQSNLHTHTHIHTYTHTHTQSHSHSHSHSHTHTRSRRRSKFWSLRSLMPLWTLRNQTPLRSMCRMTTDETDPGL